MMAQGRCVEMAREASAMPPSQPPPRSLSPDQEYDFVYEPPRDYYCAVTFDLLLDPHQTSCCGHHLSSEVVARLKREGKPCPMCQDRTFATHQDLYLRRKVREQQVRCPYKGGGCAWASDLGNRSAHLRTCPKRPWQCHHCTFSGLYEAARGHTEVCERAPIPCPNRCNIGQVQRCQLSDHLDKVCPLQEVPCQYCHAGCTVKLTRTEMEVHVQHNTQLHLLLMCSANLDLTRQLNERVTQAEAETKALKAEVIRLGQTLGERVQSVEASVIVQSEWMESNGPRDTSQPEGRESEEEGVNSVEETVKRVIANEVQGMEVRLVQALSERGQGSVAASGGGGERSQLALPEMVERQAEVMRAVEEKLDTAVTTITQIQTQSREDFKKLETALTESMERYDKKREEQEKLLMKETEKALLQQVSTSQENLEVVVARDMVKEMGKREEEVRKQMSALGERVEEGVRTVEGAVGTMEQKVVAEFSDIKTSLQVVHERTERLEELQRGMEERVGQEREVVVEELKREVGEKVGEVKTLVDKEVAEMEEKLKGLSRSVQEKVNATRHHRHKVRHVSSHPLAHTDLHPKTDELDSISKVPPLPQASLPVAGVSESPKPIREEDANRKPPRASAFLQSLPQDRSPLKVVPDSSSHPAHRPPCDFKIEQFSKLKEQNKEWRSPPFYSPRGYKMCLGLWPNGFRSGAGTHVSVEFYKMRDANTDKLKWNVKLPIHVRIYNYRTKKWEKEHVNGDTFIRSKVSGEFETSGYAQSHKLVAHDELKDYLLDDNFRIQIYKFEVKH